MANETFSTYFKDGGRPESKISYGCIRCMLLITRSRQSCPYPSPHNTASCSLLRAPSVMPKGSLSNPR